MTTVVDVASASGYTLVITDAGDLEARRPIEGDRVRRYTTAKRNPTIDRQTQSEYGLTLDAVIDRYATYANPGQSRFRLAAATADAYKWRLDTHSDHDTTPPHREADPADDTGTPFDHDSNLEMSERQRRVIERFTTDSPSTGTDETGHDVRSMLAGVHTILDAIDTDRLSDDDADQLETAREAIQSII